MNDETHPFPTDDEARAMTEPLTLKLKLPEKPVSTPTMEEPGPIEGRISDLRVGATHIISGAGPNDLAAEAIPPEPKAFTFDDPRDRPGYGDTLKIQPRVVEFSDLKPHELAEFRPEQREEMLRYNQGKPRYSLIPPSFTYYTAMVLEYGALKYSADNWRKGGKWNDTLDSLQRHLDSFRAGEDCDVESGLPHLAHMAFNVMALIEFFDKGIGTDDRYRYVDQTPGERAVGRVLAFRQPPGRE